jgi:DNA (cytosine-5)-methyltransferase 1
MASSVDVGFRAHVPGTYFDATLLSFLGFSCNEIVGRLRWRRGGGNQRLETATGMKLSGGEIEFYPRTLKSSRGFTCIDLFSGAGGLAEGFRQAGWSIRAGNDLDKYAGATFRANFPEASFYEGPVSALSARKLLRDAGLKQGELDCLMGGPPCQSFSYNNHQRSATDERAVLFRKYLQIVRALFPKTLVMENVPGMLTIGNGRVLGEIKDELRALGYECEVRVLYCEDFGVPQARRRAFIIASRLGAAAEIFPCGTHGPSEKPSQKANKFVHRWEPTPGESPLPFVTVWDAIGDLPVLRNGGGTALAKHCRAPATKFQRAVRGRATHIRNHTCHMLTDVMLKRILHVSEGGNWTEIPRKLLPAGMRRAHLKDHTKRYGRLRRKGLASTILTKCDPHWGAYIHPTQNRTISIREAARLQGFPDRFRFASSQAGKSYEQVGNAVPVPVARAIGLSLSAHIIKCQHAARRAGLSIPKRSPRIPARVHRPAKAPPVPAAMLTALRFRRGARLPQRASIHRRRYRTWLRHRTRKTRA